MSWLGKILGGAFGFFMGGPLGAMLGAAVGHQFDLGMDNMERLGTEQLNPGEQRRVQMAFFSATFSVMGHIAKADGRVTKAEINMAERVMDQLMISGEMRQTAINLFQQGKAADFPLDEVLQQFLRECQQHRNLLLMFIEIQIQAAFADGRIDALENRLLSHICARLRISRFEYELLKKQIQAQQRFYGQGYQQAKTRRQPRLDDAYAVLGVDARSSNDEIKKAYRRLMSQNHPDKLVAKGLPEEMMRLAKEKTQKIRKAYEVIREARKF